MSQAGITCFRDLAIVSNKFACARANGNVCGGREDIAEGKKSHGTPDELFRTKVSVLIPCSYQFESCITTNKSGEIRQTLSTRTASSRIRSSQSIWDTGLGAEATLCAPDGSLRAGRSMLSLRSSCQSTNLGLNQAHSPRMTAHAPLRGLFLGRKVRICFCGLRLGRMHEAVWRISGCATGIQYFLSGLFG